MHLLGCPPPATRPAVPSPIHQSPSATSPTICTAWTLFLSPNYRTSRESPLSSRSWLDSDSDWHWNWESGLGLGLNSNQRGDWDRGWDWDWGWGWLTASRWQSPWCRRCCCPKVTGAFCCHDGPCSGPSQGDGCCDAAVPPAHGCDCCWSCCCCSAWPDAVSSFCSSCVDSETRS